MLRVKSPLAPEIEEKVTQLVDVGYTVHDLLGPGFREIIYERAFCIELEERGLAFECQKRIVVEYKGRKIPGQKIDLLVEGVVLVELKAVPRLRVIHQHQVISYLDTLKLPIGLLMNFNSVLFEGSCQRVLPSPREK